MIGRGTKQTDKAISVWPWWLDVENPIQHPGGQECWSSCNRLAQFVKVPRVEPLQEMNERPRRAEISLSMVLKESKRMREYLARIVDFLLALKNLIQIGNVVLLPLGGVLQRFNDRIRPAQADGSLRFIQQPWGYAVA